MASKNVFIVLVCLLLMIKTKVSSGKEEDILTESPNLIVIATLPPLHKFSPPPPTSPSPSPSPSPHSPIPPPHPPPPAIKPPRNREECNPLCVVRCNKHSRPNSCFRVCMTCCDRCKCVPPGQYGNTEVCGKCYTGMTTHGGKLKCP